LSSSTLAIGIAFLGEESLKARNKTNKKEVNNMEGEKHIVMPVGNPKKDGVSGLEALERNLQLGIVCRMDKSFHYDELCRVNNIGGVTNRVKPVHSDAGELDVFATFMTVRNARVCKGGN